jgi:hypothetical protein
MGTISLPFLVFRIWNQKGAEWVLDAVAVVGVIVVAVLHFFFSPKGKQ